MEHSPAHQALIAELAEKAEALAALHEQVRQKERALKRLAARAVEREQDVRSLVERVQQVKHVAACETWEQQKRFADLAHERDLLRSENERLAAIEHSLSWRLARRLGRVVPARLRHLARRGVNVWLEQGTLACVRKAMTKTARKVGRLFARTTSIIVRRPLPPETSPPAPATAAILMHCDAPALHGSATVYGRVQVRGWAVARPGIQKVELSIDGLAFEPLSHGQSRPDIGWAHPDMADSDRAGFQGWWDTTKLLDGKHSLVVRVTARDGAVREQGGWLTVDNTTSRKSDYECWIEANEPKDLHEARERAPLLPHRPCLSLLLPLHDAGPQQLRRLLAAVRAQLYAEWELCICDDGVARGDVEELLTEAARADARIKVLCTHANEGPASACNQALGLATGDFVALLDADAQLHPQALYQVVRLLNSSPEADLIYGDEDRINPSGKRTAPFFKPDWSPDLMLACNYLGRFVVVRAALARAVGGFRAEYDGSHDYDLYLRLIEKTDRICHIPKVLSHQVVGLAASQEGLKVTAEGAEAACRAVADHLRRQDVDATVTQENLLDCHRVRYGIKDNPLVSIIMLTGGSVRLLERCLDSVLDRTTYRNFELVIVDNSKSDGVRALLPTVTRRWPQTRWLDCRHQPFNYSILNNQAARTVTAPLLLFLNDDTEVITAGWLEAMVEHAQRPEVGAVGAKLLYPDNTIQHAGVVLGLFGIGGHAFKHLDGAESEPAHFNLPHVVRDCSAVTAACLLTRREVFWEAGGFEEFHLPVAYQDVDLCLKIRERGYRVVYTPYAKLYHHEAKTKTEKDANPFETRFMQRKWAPVIAHDPYYSPNLTRLRDDYGIALPF